MVYRPPRNGRTIPWVVGDPSVNVQCGWATHAHFTLDRLFWVIYYHEPVMSERRLVDIGIVVELHLQALHVPVISFFFLNLVYKFAQSPRIKIP